jgi:hypothetical protein
MVQAENPRGGTRKNSAEAKSPLRSISWVWGDAAQERSRYFGTRKLLSLTAPLGPASMSARPGQVLIFLDGDLIDAS